MAELLYYVHDEATAFRFELSGDLVGEDVRKLEQLWKTASSVVEDKALVIDLSFVTAMDESGRELLRHWHERGANFVAKSDASYKFVESVTGHPVLSPPQKHEPHRIWPSWLKIALLAVIILGFIAATACSKTTSAATQPPPSDVEVVTAEQRDVPTYREWIGTLDGMVNAAIKAQVTGYLASQDYIEGSFVRKGQSLFQIDPRPFQAAVDQAQGQLAQANGQLAQAKAQLVQAVAQLASAEASQRRAQLDADRYVPLAKQEAITQQELDNAIQNNISSKAQVEAAKAQVGTSRAQIEAANAAVEAAKAALESAKVNLGFTRLTSPIDGIAGQAQVQVGNLVGPAGASITTVSTLDPIKAEFTVSEQEYLSFVRQASNRLSQLQLELILADGTAYAQKGKFLFADREVNQNTGSIQLTAIYPNPGNVLRPGQYGKVRGVIGVARAALLVPQRSVTELQGNYQVATVDAQNKVGIRNVKVGDRVGAMWLIEDGLKPGDRVIAEGVQKVGPGMIVNPKPFAAEAR